MISYKGISRDGCAVVGVTDCAPAELAARLFDLRYRELTIFERGEIVGSIERHPDTGRRVWWAESRGE